VTWSGIGLTNDEYSPTSNIDAENHTNRLQYCEYSIYCGNGCSRDYYVAVEDAAAFDFRRDKHANEPDHALLYGTRVL
jgi:hypothetical protein